jgi:hypothetical protein
MRFQPKKPPNTHGGRILCANIFFTQ